MSYDFISFFFRQKIDNVDSKDILWHNNEF